MGLSQEEMSKLMNLYLETYKRYERYEVKIPAEFIFSLAEVSNTDVREIKYK